MYFNQTEIAQLARMAANTEACAKAADATECDPVERTVYEWIAAGDTNEVRLSFANTGGPETSVSISQLSGLVTDVQIVTFHAEELPQLIHALLAAKKAIEMLNEAAQHPDDARERYEIEKQLANNPGFFDDDDWKAEAERRWGPMRKPDLHIVSAE